jgi:hypothetical protein
MTDDSSELFERNMVALKQYYPDFHEQIVRITDPVAKIVGSLETDDINIDLGHTRLYPENAKTHAERQVAEFRAVPSRFCLNPPPYYPEAERPYHHNHIASALFDHAKAQGLSGVAKDPSSDAGFLLVYGIGLGFHLPALLEEFEVRYILLLDEYPEFFYHSLHLIDWAGIFEKAAERGQTLQFTFASEPAKLAERVHWTMRGRGFGLIDGSYVFRHYSSMVLDKAHAEFREKLHLLPISIGFVEDEWVMLKNGGTNIINNDFQLLDERPRLEKNLPAFIVGSGPSLDQSIEAIKRLEGQAVIFSCGTGILPLLRNGIRPDFHCELENVVSSYDHLKRTADMYGLGGITLIGSATVWPEMPDLFDKSIFYFRDSVSSTGLWSPDHVGIYGTAPTCTNLGIRAALLMCFRQIYLFGIDLGTRDASKHHSQDAIYYRSEAWKKGYNQAAMDIEMPGNFGGKAYTNPTLHWTRMMMAHGIEAYSFAKIYNCSDGVQIPGTLPKLSRTLKIDAPPHRKPLLLQRLAAELVDKRAGEMAPVEEMRAIKSTFAAWYDGMVALVDEAKATGMSYIDFYEECAPFLAERGESPYQMALRSVHVGFMMICFQVGYFFYRRVDPELQAGLMGAFLDALKERLQVIRQEFEGHFGKLIELAATANA